MIFNPVVARPARMPEWIQQACRSVCSQGMTMVIYYKPKLQPSAFYIYIQSWMIGS
ncbi:hypothetical protein CY35_06G020900 [Sphagnum magellanicum]|nr:hypothetical protein CY35_06G020900 [Sphagnum magellanicum]